MHLLPKYIFVHLPKIWDIMNKNLHIDSFKSRFNDMDTITIDNVFDFYLSKYPNMKKNIIQYKISNLLNKGVIERIGRGKYRIGNQKTFAPFLSKSIKFINTRLTNEFPYLGISIWSTEWIVNWMIHIPRVQKIIIEVEEEAQESVYYFISDFRKNVFLEPSPQILHKYANQNMNQIIVKKLITESPLRRINNLRIPTIEKIVVDLIIDVNIFSAFQGRDLDSIVENAYRFYTINEDKLLRYASRRNKSDLVDKFIKNII